MVAFSPVHSVDPEKKDSLHVTLRKTVPADVNSPWSTEGPVS